MATKKTPTIEELIAVNAAELDAATAKAAANPGDAKALAHLGDLERERAALERVQRVAAEQAEQRAKKETAEEQAARVRELRGRLAELLEKRGKVAAEISDLLDQLGVRLTGFDVVQQDVRGIVGALRHASGRDVIRFPLHVDPRAAEASLLDRVWRSGLGRTGFRFHNRMTVEPFGDPTHRTPSPIDEAHEADTAKLREAVERMLEPPSKPATPVVPIHERLERARRREHSNDRSVIARRHGNWHR